MSEAEKGADGRPDTLPYFDAKRRREALAKDQASRARGDGKSPGIPGSRGKKNIYTCAKCFGHVVTVDVDEGVTPFTIACRATFDCDGWMRSSMYRVFDQTMKAGVEWYMPSVPELVPENARDHVAKGGLLIRKVS